jgi:hypothetical protein
MCSGERLELPHLSRVRESADEGKRIRAGSDYKTADANIPL